MIFANVATLFPRLGWDFVCAQRHWQPGGYAPTERPSDALERRTIKVTHARARGGPLDCGELLGAAMQLGPNRHLVEPVHGNGAVGNALLQFRDPDPDHWRIAGLAPVLNLLRGRHTLLYAPSDLLRQHVGEGAV